MPRTVLIGPSLRFGRILALALTVAIGIVAVIYATSRSRADSGEPNVEVELLTVRPYGFEPSEITRPKGPFVLLIDDRSGKESSSLSLQRLTGESVREVRTKRNKSDWHELLDLQPGEYVVTGDSGARCRLTILPQ